MDDVETPEERAAFRRYWRESRAEALQATEGLCHRFVSDGSFHICGQPVLPGTDWCAKHTEV